MFSMKTINTISFKNLTIDCLEDGSQYHISERTLSHVVEWFKSYESWTLKTVRYTGKVFKYPYLITIFNQNSKLFDVIYCSNELRVLSVGH